MTPFVITLLDAVAKGGSVPEHTTVDEIEANRAIQVGLGPILHDMALRLPGLISRESASALLVSELAARAHYKRVSSTAAAVLEACASSVEGVVLLKGISVADEYYPRPYWRPMGDIDILVAKEDLDLAESALKDLGYRQASPNPTDYYQTHHHSMPFLDPSNGIIVEIHTALFPPQSPYSHCPIFQLPKVTTHLRLSERQGKPVYRLSSELELLYLSCHALAEWRIFKSLVPFLDITLLLTKMGGKLDWDTLGDWLRDHRASACLCVMLSYLDKYRVVAVPPEIQTAISAAKRRRGRLALRILHNAIDRHVIGGHSIDDFPGQHNRYLLWDTLMTDRHPMLNLLWVPWNLAFPPSQPDRFRTAFHMARLRSALKSKKQ